MKQLTFIFTGMVFGLAVYCEGTRPLAAQVIVGPPPWTSTAIQTEGGVTYFVHVARLMDCDWIETSGLTRSESRLSLTAAEMQGLYCPECFDCYHTETNATVLGTLAPGGYQLAIYAPILVGPPGPPQLLQVLSFEVPAGSGPTVSVSLAGDGVRLEVRGVPAATYTLEASTNLRSWVPIHTATGAPFVFTAEMADPVARFYRVAVSSGRVSDK